MRWLQPAGSANWRRLPTDATNPGAQASGRFYCVMR